MLHNDKTNCELFKQIVEESLVFNISLVNIERLVSEIQSVTTIIQETAWKETPRLTQKNREIYCPLNVREKFMSLRRI